MVGADGEVTMVDSRWMSKVCPRVVLEAMLVLTVFAPQAARAKSYKEQVLYTFQGPRDGASPYGGVIRDSVGNLYGTTYAGGPHNLGTVYKLDTAGKESVLHSFTGQQDGANPMYVTLVQDSAGNLYGTTYTGGHGYGVVFTLNPRGKVSVLHTFNQWDGANPFAGVIRDAKGNVYVTTSTGGAEDYYGTVFKTLGTGKGKVLHSFVGGQYGNEPLAPLVQDAKGNSYGTTFQGGDNSCRGCGTVFKLNQRGKETVLYAFEGTGNGDGEDPSAGLTMDRNGNLYGTTQSGGTGAFAGFGTVFELATTGKETVLYSFTGGEDGGYPGYGSLVIDQERNLYGTTQTGGMLRCGTYGCGTVFKVDSAGKETVLYRFTGGKDGGVPYAGLVQDSAGNFYGTASVGGDLTCNAPSGCGVLFKLTPQ
jgi:uncharacterized repeat protein (TIGR03803 family)